MARVDEIAPDLFRISTFVPEIGIQFNQFLVRDDEPLLFETGMKRMFPAVREAVATLIDPSTLRHVAFSHYEPDECGSLNEWLQIAPRAQALCSAVGAMVFVDDAALRPARPLKHDEVVSTGKRRFRFQSTPHLPHGWDAGLLFEETTRTLLCSDLLGHGGDPVPVTEADVVGAFRDTTRHFQQGPLAHYMPYTLRTEGQLRGLAALKPQLCATMHGSAFRGDGARALLDMAGVMKDLLG